MNITDHLEPSRTMNIDIGETEIIVRELTGFEASSIDRATLQAIKSLIDAHEKWDYSMFELCLDRPEILLELLMFSTGLDEDYIRSLSAKYFDCLVYSFMAVNAEFLILRTKLIEMVSKNG